MEKGIIPIMSGGLGNQMFIIAASFIVSKILNCPVYIFQNSLANNIHNLKKHDYNKTIFKYFGKIINIEYTKITSLTDFKYYTYHSHGMNEGFDPWNPYNVKTGTIMASYYQYYPVFVNFEKEIRETFLKGLSEHRSKIEKLFDIKETDIFLHVRRGDYVQQSNIHFLQPNSYFYECVEQINKGACQIFVVSDDIRWVKERRIFRDKIFVHIENLDELETMALMSLCKGGAICSNSTFSWWGAFLGAYEKRNQVFVPKHWISIKEDMTDLFPKEWKQV
jgi:hypothetical protein